MLDPGDPRAPQLRDLLAQVVPGNRFYARKMAGWDGRDLSAVPFTTKAELVKAEDVGYKKSKGRRGKAAQGKPKSRKGAEAKAPAEPAPAAEAATAPTPESAPKT